MFTQNKLNHNHFLFLNKLTKILNEQSHFPLFLRLWWLGPPNELWHKKAAPPSSTSLDLEELHR